MRLDEYKREAWLCNHCSMCSEAICDDGGFYRICPVYEQLEFDDNSARGHNTIALYLLDGSLEYSADVADCVYKCTTCALCEEVCKPMSSLLASIGGSALKTMLPRIMSPLGAEMDCIQSVAIVEAMRADCVDRGLQPEALKKLADSTDKNHNPYDEPHADRTKWAQGLDIPESADTVLFVGCNTAYRRPEIAAATARILKRARIKFAVLPDEWCCGSPLLRNGNVDLAQQMIEHNVGLLREKGV